MSRMIYLGANYEAFDLLDEKFIEDSIFIDSKWHTELKHPSLLTKKKFFDCEQSIGKEKLIVHNTALIEKILSDYKLPLLFSRMGFWFRITYKSELKKYSFYLKIAKCCISFIESHSPRSVYFAYEPHSLPIYIFKKTCVALGIQCYTLTQSAFTWRLQAESIDSVLRVAEPNKKGKKSVQVFVNEKLADYNKAKPFYERLASNNRFDIFKKSSLKGIVNAIQVKRLQKSYQKLLRNRSEYGDDFIVFFLHYQPESTTLPDGNLFVDQIEAINILSKMADQLNMKLVVREHPASFRQFSNIWRPLDYYDRIISESPNVLFDDTKMCPYSLIKKSKAVSSITGSALLESLLLGKPALSFGKHTLLNFRLKGLVNYNDWPSFMIEVKDSLSIEGYKISESIKLEINNIYDYSYGLNDYPGNEAMTLELLRYSRNLAFKEFIESH